jgi:hypothetical protein
VGYLTGLVAGFVVVVFVKKSGTLFRGSKTAKRWKRNPRRGLNRGGFGVYDAASTAMGPVIPGGETFEQSLPVAKQYRVKSGGCGGCGS